MTIVDLRALLERAVADNDVSELPAVIGALAEATARAELRLREPAPAPASAEVVDVATLSAELGLAESWLRAQARANKLPHIRCGKYIKCRRAEVLAILSRDADDHRMGSPAASKIPSDGAGSFPHVSTQNGTKSNPAAPRAFGENSRGVASLRHHGVASLSAVLPRRPPNAPTD